MSRMLVRLVPSLLAFHPQLVSAPGLGLSFARNLIVQLGSLPSPVPHVAWRYEASLCDQSFERSIHLGFGLGSDTGRAERCMRGS
jgi:hypothetical protein